MFDDAHRIKAPHKTWESRRVHGMRVGEDPRVFIMSGIHGRERGGPDHVFYFVADLLHARTCGMGLQYGKRVYTVEQVQTAFSAGLVVVPLANPDGVAHDHATNSCWRKNRNTASAIKGVPASIGVDLNRNFNATWDYKRLFAPEAISKSSIASDEPSSQVFHGKWPMSEPETRNIDWMLSKHPSIAWFVDVHSTGGVVLFGWGDDDMQASDPYQSFANSTYDGMRGILDSSKGDEGGKYREYIRPIDGVLAMNTSERMSTAMKQAGPLDYGYMPLSLLYPVSGSSMDHALSKSYAEACPHRHSIVSIGMEFGQLDPRQTCPFYPSAMGYHEARTQVAVGLMELLLAAAEDDPKARTVKCEAKV